MHRFHFLCGLLLAVIGAGVGGCGQSSSPPPTATTAGSTATSGSTATNAGSTNGVTTAVPAPVQGQLKVALLTPGDINDQGWNQLAYDGLKAVQEKLGAEVAHQVTKNPADHQPALRDFGEKKFHLVICHGFEYGKTVKDIAPHYPDTMFVVVGGNIKQAPNVATLVPKLEEATYLLGIVAGGMTRTNVIGAIGGANIPVIKSTFDAYTDGAHAVNPKVTVLTGYVGNFEDQNKAKESANNMIAQKADFLFHNADQAGKGMFNAAQQASHVFVFGSNRNQNGVAPEVCLASAVIEMPHAFLTLAMDVKQGRFKPEFRELTMQRGDIGLEWNDTLKKRVPPALLKKVDDATKQIKAGQLTIKRHVPSSSQ